MAWSMLRGAMDQGATESNDAWPAHETQNVDPVVQACSFFLVKKKERERDVKSVS